MVKLLAQNASHPIFGTTSILSDSIDFTPDNWDRLVIVHYRSRRDMANIFASDEFANASAHKWAGIKSNHRLVVQATHIPSISKLCLIIFMLLMSWFAWRIIRLRLNR